MSFAPTLDELRAAVDASLKAFLAERAQALPDAEPMIGEAARLMAAGGKRLRPAFCYWGYRAAGAAHSDAIVRAAGALELLHTFAIVHDDIMDGADRRRGQATVHALHGVNVALLVGDLALALADDALMTSDFPADALGRAFVPYSRMRQEVIAGQYLDLRAAGSQTITEAEARRIAVLKSGRYSITEPLQIGAALAGASRELSEGLFRFGEPLGEAFQLRDDLLGIFGEQSATGKPTDSDIREGKRNLLFAKALESLEGRARRRLIAAWGGGAALSTEQVSELRDLVEASGARAATESLLVELVETAGKELDALGLEAEPRAALGELVQQSTQRLS